MPTRFRSAFAKGVYFNTRIRDRFPYREINHEDRGNAILKPAGATIARMIPMRTSSVFKSRWMALLWAAGIIWFAYDFAAPSASRPTPTQPGRHDARRAGHARRREAARQALNSF